MLRCDKKVRENYKYMSKALAEIDDRQNVRFGIEAGSATGVEPKHNQKRHGNDA
jgi:hypothetical protein